MTAALDSHQLARVREALHRPTVPDAKHRVPVHGWHHGKPWTGRLVRWPASGRGRCRVQLPSGARITVPCASTWLIDPAGRPLDPWDRATRDQALADAADTP